MSSTAIMFLPPLAAAAPGPDNFFGFWIWMIFLFFIIYSPSCVLPTLSPVIPVSPERRQKRRVLSPLLPAVSGQCRRYSGPGYFFVPPASPGGAAPAPHPVPEVLRRRRSSGANPSAASRPAWRRRAWRRLRVRNSGDQPVPSPVAGRLRQRPAATAARPGGPWRRGRRRRGRSGKFFYDAAIAPPARALAARQ